MILVRAVAVACMEKTNEEVNTSLQVVQMHVTRQILPWKKIFLSFPRILYLFSTCCEHGAFSELAPRLIVLHLGFTDVALIIFVFLTTAYFFYALIVTIHTVSSSYINRDSM